MTITDPKKRTTETSPKAKHATEPSDDTTRSKPSASKAVEVIRRPASQANPATAPAKADDAKPKRPTYEKRMRALAPITRLRRKLTANATRLATIHREVQRWANAPAELRDAATAVTTALAAMLALATALPDDFKPARERKGGARQLVPGAKAVLRAKVAPRYDGIIGPDERENLEIVSVARGGLVSVKTVTGSHLVLPRSHVTKAAAG